MALISPPAKPGGGGPAAQVVTPAGRREALSGSSAGSRGWLDPERNRANAAALLERSAPTSPWPPRARGRLPAASQGRSHGGRAQLAMIRRLGTGGRFGVAIAAAGAGKTTALQPLVAA